MTTDLTHPAIARLKEGLGDLSLRATVFRGDTTVVASAKDVHRVLRFLRDDPACDYDLLVDVTAADYLDYPARTPGRFGVIWLLASTATASRIAVKTHLDPSIDTSGNEADPALVVDTSTDIWPGAEWREREVYDMYGIRFRDHPDMRRILLWKDYPAFPLRKDYPLRGRGERSNYEQVQRQDA